jgi:hypothetical protein
MVEVGTIRKKGFTGVPLPLGANTLTETGRNRNPTGGPRREGLLYDRCSPPPVMQSNGDAVEFVPLMQHLRPVYRLGNELILRDRHHEIPRSSDLARMATQTVTAACDA